VSDEKPFEATPSRLERARREGDSPRSSDLSAVVAFAAAALALVASLGTLAAAFRALLEDAARGETSAPLYLEVACAALTVPAAGAAAAVAVAVVQSRGLRFVFPAPKFDKLHPGRGLKRMFSREAAAAALKSLAVVSAVALALAPAVAGTFAAGAGAAPLALAQLTLDAAERVAAGALLVGAAFAAVDVQLERRKWKQRLRMSFDEMKRDRQQSEGDPLQRGRRRQAHRALARSSLQQLARAAFVVANPTHVAVALEYRLPEVPVPRVVLRGADAAALLIKQRARDLGIPVVEDIALARRLFAACEAGMPIPSELYVPVAQIVAALLGRKELAR
jgi:flagellar biosynthetic protein FlhB